MAHSETDPLEPGDLLAGKYEIVRVLGRGGMGLVYEAVHQKLGSRVAVKVLNRLKAENQEFAIRFEREAQAAANLSSPYIAKVFDVDALPSGSPYLVMEFLVGRDLAAERKERGQIPIREAVDYVLQACSALATAHESGVVHRDVKPHNLFLASEGHKRLVKLLDFGISKVPVEADDAMTSTYAVLGTPVYMSPEQIRSAKNVDARTDVWSLGVVLYELLSGQRPFRGENPSAVIVAITVDEPVPIRESAKRVPESLWAVIQKTLSKDPDQRYASMQELGRALAPFGSTMSWPPPPTDDAPALDAIPSSRQDAVPTEIIDMKGAPIAGASAPTQVIDPMAETSPGVAPTRTDDRRALPASAVVIGALLLVGALVWGWSSMTSRSGDALETPSSSQPPAMAPAAASSANTPAIDSVATSAPTEQPPKVPPTTASAAPASPSVSPSLPAPRPVPVGPSRASPPSRKSDNGDDEHPLHL